MPKYPLRLQVDDGFKPQKFALMAIRMSKGGGMRDPRDTYRNQLVPTVVEQTNRGERAYDIYSRLLKERSYSLPARSTTT